MPMASICTDFHALNCKNCSQMVYWILVELENDIFLVFGFWLLVFSKKKFFLLFPNENYIGFHMRYHLFLQYGWFLQNLGKEAVRTNMHTTVIIAHCAFICFQEKSCPVLLNSTMTVLCFY